jgi:hypothetical protein
MVHAKPDQLPHEDEPYQNRRIATEQAIRQAVWHAPGQITPAQAKYATKAFQHEIDALEAQTQGSRNHTLNTAAFNLAQLVAAGALDEHEVRSALYEACRVNGHLQDDGEHMVRGTIESGFEGGLKHPRDLSHVTSERTVYVDDDEPRTKSLTRVQDIESGFWTKRDSLQSIYLGALARMCSPWAVLAICAARALALVRPNATLPPIIGGPGSLNWFAAIAGTSSAGKDAADEVAKELVNEAVMTRNLGSGEGLIDAYIKPANKETGEPKGQHEAIMFVADEIDTMHALSTRNGSTLSGILRSAFTAKAIGFSYRTSSSEHLLAHTYRLTLIVNVQPGRAGALLDDEYGGMLQRFMWFPATDSRVTVDTPLMPAKLELPAHSAWQYPRELKVPYAAKHLMKQVRAKANQDDGNNLDGHALFAREKFAFALAVLDGRDEMTEEDWRLAGVASRVSDHTLMKVREGLAAAREADAIKRGQDRGIQQYEANRTQEQRSARKLADVASWCLEKLTAAGECGTTEGELRHAYSREAHLIGPALKWLETRDRAESIERKAGDRTNRWVAAKVE